MIQKIDFSTISRNYADKFLSNKKPLNNPISGNNDNNTLENTSTFKSPTSKLLHSYYVSFEGKKGGKSSGIGRGDNDYSSYEGGINKMEEIENNVSYNGEKFIEDTRDLAKKYGHDEITQVHVLRVGLESVKDFIEKLDSGELSYDEASFYAFTPFEDDLGQDTFKNKSKRDKIKPIIDEEIKFLDEKLSAMPKSSSKNKSKGNIQFSKNFLNDIYSQYMQDNEEDMGGDGLVHDSTFMSAALYPHNDKIKKEITVPLIFKLKDAVQLDKRPLSERIHLSFYDEKAKLVWKNLAVGTNMVILYDKGTTPDYTINSFLQLFDKSKNGFGNLTKDNTEIVNFNNNGELDDYYIKRNIREFGKHKDKNYVLMMSIMDDDMSSIAIDETNYNIFKNAPKNVKFVFVAEKDTYYRNSTDGDAKDFFSEVGEVSVPLMNVSNAKKMFREQSKLTEKIKKPFSSQAVDKCVELSNQLKGNYPEKAQRLMELISSYYVDKQKISVADVQNYAKEAKEVFKPIDNDGSIKVVFDTGIKLKDMVGTPTTKKEAKSIVDRIKDRTIGTKGFVIYSQDGSVGAGRKYTAQAIAGETHSPYIEINAVDFGTKDVDLFGGGNLSPEASMKKLFSVVKTQAETTPSKSAVLFVENFDYFSYGEAVSEYHEKAMAQMIREMNRASEQGLNIIVIGSMNNPQNIGESTSKSFKFIDQIEVESPGFNNSARIEIIDYYIKKNKIRLAGDDRQKEIIKEHINSLTEFSSYIEILTLLDKAKNVARERKHSSIEKGDFTEAYLQLLSGRPSLDVIPEYRKNIVTSHECGHALNTIIMEELFDSENKPAHKGSTLNFITLDPRGDFGGAVFSKSMENPEYSFEHVFSEIVADFGGTSCEKYFYNQDGSWGITCDMQMATNMASKATAIMGQGKNFGKKSLNGMLFIGDDDKAKINKDIDVILKNSQIVSDAITEIYADFNREFTKKYAAKVGTGDCIIQREEFLKLLNEWRMSQSPEKQREFALLNDTILKVIDATKRGVVCRKAGE